MAIPFGRESWIWYICGIGMIIARLIARRILFRSFKGLQLDDWIMGTFVIVTFTALMVVSNIWFKAGSNLEPPDFDFVGSGQLTRRIYGSKMMIVTEQMQISVIWACKTCLLVMYYRLTRTALRNENVAIKVLSAYVLVGYVVMQILYFSAWCRPFHEYYAVPTHSAQCNTLLHHRITKAVFNISSDLIMLSIAMQMLIRSTLPWRRKLVLCGVFSLGIFVIACATLNSYYSFVRPYNREWMFWYVRESSTAIIVANVPFTWTILRELFELGDFDKPAQPWTFHPHAPTPAPRNAQQNSSSQFTRRSLIDTQASRTPSTTLVGSSGNAASPAKSPTMEDIERGMEIQAVRSQGFAPA